MNPGVEIEDRGIYKPRLKDETLNKIVPTIEKNKFMLVIHTNETRYIISVYDKLITNIGVNSLGYKLKSIIYQDWQIKIETMSGMCHIEF